jgi:HEPN domain-containing protein
VGFHAQQCAEKALKAYLTFHRVSFERRHDLNYLIDLCAPLDPGFEQFRAPADELTPYAVEFRHLDTLPLMPLEPVRAAADTAGHRFSIAFLSEAQRI